MKGRQRTYEDMLDEEMEKMGARSAWLKADVGQVRAEADIKYYKTIEAVIAAEEGTDFAQ